MEAELITKLVLHILHGPISPFTQSGWMLIVLKVGHGQSRLALRVFLARTIL